MIDNAFARGYDHIKENSPREDFGETKVTDSCRIFAVADGHGDSNCPRSSFGSETACHVAIAGLEHFAKEIAENSLGAEIIAPGKNQEKRIRPLIATIVSMWRDAVNAEFTANPLTPEERAKCDRYLERYDRGEKIEHIYGTTLIAGLLTDKYLLLLQQGDGRCDVFGANGEVSQPIPWDDKCFANVTTSLCEDDASERCRYCVIDIAKNPVIACIADSDGVEDSFASMELLHCYHRDILIYACEKGISALYNYLKDTLPEMSENYSRDDITICGFADLEKVLPHVSTFKRANERVRIESKLAEVDARLKSFDSMGKLAGLRAQYEKACTEVVRIETELNEANGDLETVHSALEHINSQPTSFKENLKRRNPQLWEQAYELPKEIDALRTKLKKLLDDKEKKEQAYKDYQGKKDSLLREREEVQAELSRSGAEPTLKDAIHVVPRSDPVTPLTEQEVSATVDVGVAVEEKNAVDLPQYSVANVQKTTVPINEGITDDLATKLKTLEEDVCLDDATAQIRGEMPPVVHQEHYCYTKNDSGHDCLPQVEMQIHKNAAFLLT
jgi:hypothetical protein